MYLRHLGWFSTIIALRFVFYATNCALSIHILYQFAFCQAVFNK